SIESSPLEVIRTFSSSIKKGHEMSFRLSAASQVRFGGSHHIHGWLQHRFTDSPPDSSLRLIARARQFSSFVVLLGRVVAANQFEPKYAFIARNKDFFSIPLEMETIPTPKEFR